MSNCKCRVYFQMPKATTCRAQVLGVLRPVRLIIVAALRQWYSIRRSSEVRLGSVDQADRGFCSSSGGTVLVDRKRRRRRESHIR